MAYTYYNLTNLTNQGNSTTVYSFVEEINTVMGGLPGFLIYAAIILVLFMVLKQRGYPVDRCFAASMFVGVIIAIMMYPMHLITGWVLVLSIILFAGGLFVLWVFGGDM